MNDKTQKYDFYMSIGDSDWAKIEPKKRKILKVNILGTEYEIIKKLKDKESCLNELYGYCDFREKIIVYLDLNTDDNHKEDSELSKEMFIKEILRHEILHAFFFESGLNTNSLRLDDAWARNEEMVDWFAIQAPKIYEVYKQLDIL